ncbi:hypothetical protein RHGRI_002014 [Rhododendron griersonianum]|uniref:Uncharacterized protein n=1 Tax=Rhododendron griersonianum TaxID=479676 RepID=A0AAV6LN91_9ERIC|nr:hypothetical protein RHGRI_002014 [Rhododendron griersonianum]
MPNKRLKVAVLLSGGVDSSVALRLLHAAGHSCTAFYLKIWFQNVLDNLRTFCCIILDTGHFVLALRNAFYYMKYVVEKDVKNNVVFVSRNYFSLDKRRRLFRVGSLKWLGDSIPIQMSQLRCKVRHGPGFYNCSLAMEFGKDGKVAVVQIFEDDQGLAARQFAAFYEGRTCLGSGVILESWDNQGFPVCAKALEVAAMGDKSKLGKPVKIKAKQEEACGMESEQKDCVELEVAAVSGDARRALEICRRAAELTDYPAAAGALVEDGGVDLGGDDIVWATEVEGELGA